MLSHMFIAPCGHLWERVDLLALVCDVLLCFFTFPCGILGLSWYLIVLTPDVCRLSYFFLTYGVIFLVVMILNLLVNRLMRRSQQKSSAFLVC